MNADNQKKYARYKSQLEEEGYSIVPEIYSEIEIARICELISKKELKSDSVLKTNQLFAIRQLLNEIPELMDLILNPRLESLLKELRTEDELFLSKAIYFDKPEGSNWFVAYHQDLIINVSKKSDNMGFRNWTNKRGQIGVQPPIEYLNRTITLRIHLDDTNETNGALRVVPKSHTRGIVRIEEQTEKFVEVTCNVQRGGVMLMKPLTLHASSRSTGEKNRRVIHLELCDLKLPEPLKWKEEKRMNSKHN